MIKRYDVKMIVDDYGDFDLQLIDDETGKLVLFDDIKTFIPDNRVAEHEFINGFLRMAGINQEHDTYRYLIALAKNQGWIKGGENMNELEIKWDLIGAKLATLSNIE